MGGALAKVGLSNSEFGLSTQHATRPVPVHVARAATTGLDRHGLDRQRAFDDGSVVRVLVVAFLLLPLSCSQPDPAARNEVLAPGDGWNRVVLDGRQRDEALAIMRSTAAVPDPEFPQAAPRGVRWSDVPAAATLAAAAVEMAIVTSAQPGTEDWDAGFLAKPPAALVGDLADGRERWVFEFKDLRDDRGWLVVIRDPSAPHGEVGPVDAAIGVLARRTDATTKLVETFEQQLRALGAKPGFKQD